MKIKYKDLPEKTKAAIDKAIKVRLGDKNNMIRESQLSWLIYYNIGIMKKFDDAYTIINWLNVIKDFKLLTPAIEEELFPFIFSSHNQ